jgi:transposase
MEQVAIGIDPDSGGYVCTQVGGPRSRSHRFAATGEGLSALVTFLQLNPQVLIAVEGVRGQSLPLEQALFRHRLRFYSFSPLQVEKFRRAVLGQNKTNERDAEATARLAISLAVQEKLEPFARLYEPDEELLTLTRMYDRRNRELSREYSLLWKLLKLTGGDLYLFLKGEHPLSPYPKPFLEKLFILSLLSGEPDASLWKRLPETRLRELLGRMGRADTERIIASLHALSARCQPLSATLSLEIADVAGKLLGLERQQEKRRVLIEQLALTRPALEALLSIRGFGPYIAGTLAAEIIDIRRFPSNDHLASYAGLVRVRHGTGEGRKEERERHRNSFNTRLKNCFFSAAMRYCQNNPDSHLCGYFRNLVKAGMGKNEAYKRVARALVRLVYRTLRAVKQSEDETAESACGSGTQGASSNVSSSGVEHTPRGEIREYPEQEREDEHLNLSNSA